MKKIWYKILLLVLVWGQKNLPSEARGVEFLEPESKLVELKLSIREILKDNLIKNRLEEIINGFKTKEDIDNFDEYLQSYIDLKNPSLFKDRIKKRAGKAWKKIKEYPKTTAAVVGLAALGGGAYFFREGISQHFGKVKDFSKKGWSIAKERGSSAWEYAREIPGKVKGKFKKG